MSCGERPVSPCGENSPPDGAGIGSLLIGLLAGLAESRHVLMDAPVMIEIVDTAAKIESFLDFADEAIGDGLATVERVEIRIHRSEGSEA